uniref:DNA replication and repair protein RecF n=1 Tax=Magnetococcus massalia (strain MO-1) TaxID=451514 RepID=A0A1S7LN73_MAGMO|nr:Putative DNA replication and repair protein recF, putative gap repair protein [Candidatus Magnetococcus massalia]
MYLACLTLRDFRNIEAAELRFGPGLNLITGANGHGKSNLLEAIGMLATGRSFRKAPGSALRRHGQPWFHIQGESRARELDHHVSFYGESGRQAVKINGKPTSAASAMGQALAAVICTPDALRLVQDGPAIRRSFLDWVTFANIRGHAGAARDYQSALKARNKLLRNPHYNAREWQVWEEQLAELGARIATHRRVVLAQLRPHLDAALVALGLDPERFSISLNCQLAKQDPFWADQGDTLQASEIAQACKKYGELLLASREGDRRGGNSTVGPHRDDLTLKLDGYPLARFGSQGQQKRTALALKLAEAALLEKNLGEAPLFLLDDPAAELDRTGIQLLMGNIAARGGQVFVATCEASDIPWSGPSPESFQVRDGLFETLQREDHP